MRRKALAFGLILAAVLGRPALAQDITQHLDQIGAGSYLIFDSGGRNFTQVYRGLTGQTYVIDLIEGADPNGDRLSREYRDGLGQLVRVDFSNGMSMRFTPHNCQRTLGACVFVQSGPDGDTQQGRVVTAVGDGYSYELSVFPSPGRDPVVVESGHLDLDDMGTVIGGHITAQDGTKQQVTLVQAVYR
jgi:hypothetical protein